MWHRNEHEQERQFEQDLRNIKNQQRVDGMPSDQVQTDKGAFIGNSGLLVSVGFLVAIFLWVTGLPTLALICVAASSILGWFAYKNEKLARKNERDRQLEEFRRSKADGTNLD